MESPRIVPKSAYERLHAEWQHKSEEAFARMFAPELQEQLVTFTEREDRAMEVGQNLANWLIAEHAAADPAAQPSLAGESQPLPAALATACLCPKCGKPGVRRTQPDDPLPERHLTTRAGRVGLEREQLECTTCRVVFFPLGPEDEARV
jgi:hypothetical protein